MVLNLCFPSLDIMMGAISPLNATIYAKTQGYNQINFCSDVVLS